MDVVPPAHRLQVKLLAEPQGEERFGKTLAELDIPIDGPKGWLLYQRAVHGAVAPECVLTFPAATSAEEAERIRVKWIETHGRGAAV